MDGADQSAYALSQFTDKVKESRGHGLLIHLLGLLNHGRVNSLHRYTMSDEHYSGANKSVEVLYRFLNQSQCEEPQRPMLVTLFIQLDNCWREEILSTLFVFVKRSSYVVS